jgi:hypothetical protein
MFYGERSDWMSCEQRTPASELLQQEITRILSKADERELSIVYQFVKVLDK